MQLVKACEELGAGEILLNSIDEDGKKEGFDLDLIKVVSQNSSLPLIASSGAGKPSHFVDLFQSKKRKRNFGIK